MGVTLETQGFAQNKKLLRVAPKILVARGKKAALMNATELHNGVQQASLTTPRDTSSRRGGGTAAGSAVQHFPSRKGSPFAKDTAEYFRAMRFWVTATIRQFGVSVISQYNHAGVKYAQALEDDKGLDRLVWTPQVKKLWSKMMGRMRTAFNVKKIQKDLGRIS